MTEECREISRRKVSPSDGRLVSKLDFHDLLGNLSAFGTWSGDDADAAQEAIAESPTKLELSAQEAFLVSLGANRAYQEAQAVTKEVRALLAYAAETPAVEVNTVKARSKWHIGPISFVASLMNILMLVLSMWSFYIATFRGYEFFLPFFGVNLVVSVVLSLLRGSFGQVGRGLLIGWLSVPTSLVLFISGFAIANAIGPI